MGWKNVLKADPSEWLLEEDIPSVRYSALKDLQGLGDDAPEVQDAQRGIMESTLVMTILQAQKPEGNWEKEDDLYLPKYTATTHQLLLLAEAGALRAPEIEKAIEHVYRFQRNSGHFLTKLPKTEKGRNSVVKDGCCYDGNILFYLIHFGYLDDPRTKKLLRFTYDYYDKEKTGWKCRAYPIDPAKVFPFNCFMGRTKVLKALSTIPEPKRDPEMRAIIDLEVEKILENEVFRYLKKPDGSRKEKAGWKRFGFPLFYQADLLEVLDTLTRLGVRDERMRGAVDVVINAQQPDGKWLLKNTYNGKMWMDIEEKHRPSKWITLRAMRVLKNWFEF
jgi:hypothetical protein